MTPQQYLTRQRGVASWAIIVYALVGVLAALGATMAVNSTSTRAVMINNAAKQLQMQANMIRAQITSCAIGDPATGRSGDNGTGLNPGFPYTGSNAGVKAGGTPVGSAGPVDSLYCPRTLSGSNWVVGATDVNLWSGVGGVFLAPPPNGMNAWQYANTASAVKIYISYTGTNAEMAAAIGIAAAKFGAAEVSTVSPNTLVVCVVVNSGTCA